MFKLNFFPSVYEDGLPLTQELFDYVIDNQDVAEICKQIYETGDKSLKIHLGAISWHASFEKGKRKYEFATQSGLTLIDIDIPDGSEDPREIFERVKEKAKEMGLVVAHVSASGKGLRLVFILPEGMTIAEAQRWIVDELKLPGFDSRCKDLARLSFIVPRDYWLYIDYDALFGETLVIPPPSPRIPQTLPLNQQTLPASQPVPQQQKYEAAYNGTPYSAIVEALESLYGGKPQHGCRNNQIFAMACDLRYICDSDPNWIAQILPDYGEDKTKWLNTISSACKRPLSSQYMPARLTKAIEMAKLSASESDSTENKSALLFDPVSPPNMPENLPHLIQILTRNVPEICRPWVANGGFPSLVTHMSDVLIPMLDGTKREINFMTVCLAPQSSGKSAVNQPIKYILADIKERDDVNRRREQEWRDAVNKAGNREKPERPSNLCVQIIASDLTNAALLMRLREAGTKYLFCNLEELQLLNQLQVNGNKDVSKIICLCYDNGYYGQERVGAQSITTLLPLRFNWNASATPEAGRDFFRNNLLDGTLTRINLCTIIKDDTKEFKYGEYNEQFAAELKPYITNLTMAKGEIHCPEALAMAERLQRECTEIALQSEDVIYQEFAYRAVAIAYMKAMTLYIANNHTWDKSIEVFCEWSLKYDLWCKNHFFGEEIAAARAASKHRRYRYRRGNMLNMLPDAFTREQYQEIRRQNNLDPDPKNHILSVWKARGYIRYNPDTDMYEKVERYRIR